MSKSKNLDQISKQMSMKISNQMILDTNIIWKMAYQLQKEARIYGIINLLLQFPI